MARPWARACCRSSAVVWIRRKSCVVSCSFIRCCWVQSPLQMLGKTSPTLTQHSHLVRLSYSSTLLFSTKIICFWRCTTCENEKWNNLLYYIFSKFLYQLCSWFMILTIEVTINYARPYISSQRCKLPHLCKFQCCAACNWKNCIIGNILDFLYYKVTHVNVKYVAASTGVSERCLK